jgi:hypothetical protein
MILHVPLAVHPVAFPVTSVAHACTSDAPAACGSMFQRTVRSLPETLIATAAQSTTPSVFDRLTAVPGLQEPTTTVPPSS